VIFNDQWELFLALRSRHRDDGMNSQGSNRGLMVSSLALTAMNQK
jgi:hypothetical protein